MISFVCAEPEVTLKIDCILMVIYSPTQETPQHDFLLALHHNGNFFSAAAKWCHIKVLSIYKVMQILDTCVILLAWLKADEI